MVNRIQRGGFCLTRALSNAGPELQGGRVAITLRDGGIEVQLQKGSPKATRNQLYLVRELQAERRAIDSLFRLDAVVQLEEQINFLVAQLSTGDREEKGPGAVRLATLRGEHHRLDGLWRQVQQLRAVWRGGLA